MRFAYKFFTPFPRQTDQDILDEVKIISGLANPIVLKDGGSEERMAYMPDYEMPYVEGLSTTDPATAQMRISSVWS